MTVRFRAYTSEDMLKVRQFLSHVYSNLGRPNSWLIARFEFEIFFLQKNAGWLPEWEQNIALWEEEDGNLVAVACKDGDFYFQLDTEQPQESLLMEMFEFIEERSRYVNSRLLQTGCSGLYATAGKDGAKSRI